MYSAARQAVEAEPLNAAAQNLAGLVAEDRGDLPAAATAFRSAATLAAAPRSEACCRPEMYSWKRVRHVMSEPLSCIFLVAQM